jgi:hypothetical protein
MPRALWTIRPLRAAVPTPATPLLCSPPSKPSHPPIPTLTSLKHATLRGPFCHCWSQQTTRLTRAPGNSCPPPFTHTHTPCLTPVPRVPGEPSADQIHTILTFKAQNPPPHTPSRPFCGGVQQSTDPLTSKNTTVPLRTFLLSSVYMPVPFTFSGCGWNVRASSLPLPTRAFLQTANVLNLRRR